MNEHSKPEPQTNFVNGRLLISVEETSTFRAAEFAVANVFMRVRPPSVTHGPVYKLPIVSDRKPAEGVAGIFMLPPDCFSNPWFSNPRANAYRTASSGCPRIDP